MRESWGASPGVPADGVDAAISSGAADICSETSEKEPSKEEKRNYASFVMAAPEQELGSWKEFYAFRPAALSGIKTTIADTLRGWTWGNIEGGKSVMSGYQDPDLQRGPVETARCVSLCSSHSHSAPRRNGVSGVWILKMPPHRRIRSPAAFWCAPFRNGAPYVRHGLGNCAMRLMVSRMLLRHLSLAFTNIFWMGIVAARKLD